MTSTKFADALNEQVANEFAASQQYVAIAVYYDAETLPRLAAFFYRQAVEERNHAMMMVQLPARRRQRCDPRCRSAGDRLLGRRLAGALALDQEKRVSEQISALSAVARDEGDYPGEQFMQWFIKEQVEEVATMSTCSGSSSWATTPCASRSTSPVRRRRRRGR